MSCKCIACGKEFETNAQLKGHFGQCKAKREILPRLLSKELLYKLMFVENMSANYIGQNWLPENCNYKISAGPIIKLAREYGFKTRSVAEANLRPEKNNLARKTNRERYGVDNVSQSPEIKKKKEDTFMKHYGLKNIFEDKEYIRERFFQKHGVYHPTQMPGYTIDKCYGFKSKLQQRVEKILDNLNIKYVSDVAGNFLKYNEELKRNYNPRPDILIEDKKIVIEIQGDHWHANPKFFKPSDVLDWLWTGEKTAEEIWKKDNIRKRHIESFGYIVYFIWGDDIIHNIAEVEKNIKNWLNIKEDETC